MFFVIRLEAKAANVEVAQVFLRMWTEHYFVFKTID